MKGERKEERRKRRMDIGERREERGEELRAASRMVRPVLVLVPGFVFVPVPVLVLSWG